MKKATHWPLTILGSASSLFNLFLPILMSRRMTLEGVGAFKVFFLYLATVPALSLGIGFTNGTYLWGSDPQRARAKVQSAFALAIMAGLFACTVALCSGMFFGWSPPLFLFALACTPAVAGTIYEASLVASGRVRHAALFSAGFEFLRLSTLILGLLAEQSAATLFLLHAAVTWAKTLASAYAIGAPSRKDFQEEKPALLRYALPVSAAAIFDLLVLNADRYVLSALLAAASFAVYSFGCLAVPPLLIFEQSVNQVLIPKLARARRGSRAVRGLFRTAQEDLQLILVPAAAGLIFLANPLIRMLFTEAYRDAARFLQWYALFYALSSIPQDVLARARGDSPWIFRTAVIFGTLAVTASFAGAKYFGAVGALQAFVLMQTARRAYGLYYFASREKARFTAVFPLRSSLVIAGASVAAGLAARAVAQGFSHPSQAFFAGAFAFGPIYFGLVYAFRPRALARLLRFRRRR